MRYLKDKTIGVIGLGNMGCALLKGLIKSGAVKRNRLFGYDVDLKKCQNIKRRFRISIAQSIEGLSERSDAIIMAVKPKDMDLVLSDISLFGKKKLLISIAAGVRTRRIEKKLGKRPRVVRAMPNTPALVGEGISAICKGRYATKGDLKIAKAIFFSAGDCVELGEKYFDLVTAISGSGPAYFFYLIEALVDAGIDLGLKKEILKKLVSKTALGSARLLIESEEDAGVLRQRVTSKGGTTEAAIRVFEKSGTRKIIACAVRAAIRRSKELSRS
ncbi:MAG: pyrroline-5-carboxylate reductase [Candidatus Omnitrophota bacterium]